MGLLRLANSSLHMTGAVADLSISVQFDGPQPSHFGALPAQAEPMRADGFTGDTRQGGSCNAERITLNPHCNGTHTECVGHLTTDRVSINDVCPALPLYCALVTVETQSVVYEGTKAMAITPDVLGLAVKKQFVRARKLTGSTPTALAIRTLPNGQDKQEKHYTSTADSPYIEPSAVEWMVRQGIDHLLVDLPSIDPYSDQGKLAAHRVLFGLPAHEECPVPSLADASRSHTTITELIYVRDEIDDGLYLLNLQIPAFSLNAAPSRPLLYALESA
ncbi:MAG: cyclase family protein [Gammaproteobacteria bacterium]